MTVPAFAQAFALYLSVFGCQLPCAAGVIANWEAESSFRTYLAGRSGLGAMQLMGPRRRRFLTWAGPHWSELQHQWDFMRVELREQGIKDAVFSAATPENAAKTIMLEYERPASKDPAFRMWRARLWYDWLLWNAEKPLANG